LVRGFQIRLRPIIFGVDRFSYKENQIWHINGKVIIDFFWKCFKEELILRNCQLKYDYQLWGGELESIVRYFKIVTKKPQDFEELYNKLLAT